MEVERAQICLINASATGCEILKSLVLPGCGGFTIVDDKRVSGEDVGNNFFLDHGSQISLYANLSYCANEIHTSYSRLTYREHWSAQGSRGF